LKTKILDIQETIFSIGYEPKTLAKAAEQANDPIREKLHALQEELVELTLAYTELPRTKEGKKLTSLFFFSN